MSTRITVDQLERMKTHEVADLLANVVLLLRRMPNVECSQLAREADEHVFAVQQEQSQGLSEASPLTQAELKKKTLPELRKIANDLHLSFPAKIKKEDLITKIVSRSTKGHSEQYTIQDI